MAARMMELGVKAELEVHDSGHVDFALQLLKAMNAPFVTALESDTYSPEVRSAIGNENAVKLFPRIARALHQG